MKNKGFTLVELLVSIVILGIITGLSIPLLRTVSNSRNEKQYKTYMNSLIASAKLYNDTYSEDLFGKNDNGCARVTFQTLKEAKLLKDISINNITCNSEYTKVRIIKYQGKYYYSAVLGCGGKKDGENSQLDNNQLSYKSKETDLLCSDKDDDGVEDPDYSENQTSSLLSVSIRGNVGSTFNSKRKTAKVHINSPFGINQEVSLYYAWSLSSNYSSIGSGDWKKVNIKIPTVKAQEKKNNK